MVHRVVVHQGGQVDQLGHRREECRPRIPAADRFFGQQQERGPEQFPLHLEQVGIHFGDQAEIRLDDAPELLLDLIQAQAERMLQLGQCHRCGLGGHRRRPAPRRWIR